MGVEALMEDMARADAEEPDLTLEPDLEDALEADE